MSAAYEAALESARVAGRAYTEAQRQYRAGEIGDTEFLKARAEYKASESVFDAAFSAEQAQS